MKEIRQSQVQNLLDLCASIINRFSIINFVNFYNIKHACEISVEIFNVNCADFMNYSVYSDFIVLHHAARITKIHSYDLERKKVD